MSAEMSNVMEERNPPASRRASIGKKLIGPCLALGTSLLCAMPPAAAAEKKVVVLYAPSAAPVAQSVTQALSASDYELKQVDATDALEVFCNADGAERPDMVLSTIEMAPHIEDKCGAGDIAKAEIGYLTLVFMQKASDTPLSLTDRQIYLALSAVVPSDDMLEVNKVVKWSEVDPALPDLPIKVLLPDKADPERYVFDADVLVAGCRGFPAVRKIFAADERTARCLSIRQELTSNYKTEEERIAALKQAGPGAIALLMEGADDDAENLFRVIPFNGILPTPEDVVAENYTLSVPVYLYAHAEQLSGDEVIEPVRKWFLEAISERAISESGYLDRFGFASVPAATREWQRKAFSE